MRRNKNIYASKQKVAGKQTTSWLKWHHSFVGNSSMTSVNLEFIKNFVN